MTKSNTLYKKLSGLISSSVFLKLTFAWFIVQSLYMSLSTRLGVSPDETYHYSFISLFEKNGWLPFIHNQTGYYSLGEVVHTPFFLYHYLLSLPMHFFSGSIHALEILRLINIALAVWSLALIVKLARKLNMSPLVTNLSMFMLANTLMFVFLSGFINYDNLLIPLTFLSFVLTIDFLDEPALSTFLKLFLVIIAGLLTAINFLPIAFGIALVMACQLVRRPKARSIFSGNWARSISANKLLLIPAIVLSLLFLQRYGYNVVRYHQIDPGCLKVNTYSQCSQNGIFNRSKMLSTLPAHSHPTPFEYFTQWGLLMRTDTFGVLGHESIEDNKIIRIWSEIFLVAGSFVVVRYYKPSRSWNLIIGLGVLYTSMLFMKNYLGFYHTGYSFGVQGRYLFVFLPLLYLLFNKYLLEFLRKDWLKSAYLSITILIFAVSALPTYILKTDNSWYKNPRAARVNADLKKVELKIKAKL